MKKKVEDKKINSTQRHHTASSARSLIWVLPLPDSAYEGDFDTTFLPLRWPRECQQLLESLHCKGINDKRALWERQCEKSGAK